MSPIPQDEGWAHSDLADTPRPADPLTEEEIAALRLVATELRNLFPDNSRDWSEDWDGSSFSEWQALSREAETALPRLLATLDAARAPRSDDALRAALDAMVKASEGVQWKIGGEHKGPGEAYLDAVINARNLLFATPAAPPTEEPMRFSDEGTYLDPKYTKGDT